MTRTILIYAVVLGLCAAGIQWLDAQVLGQRLSSEVHMIIIAVGFAALGAWLAVSLTGNRVNTEKFEPNLAAIASLGLTKRECTVLAQLGEGLSYKEIARTLNVSPNTIKTHVSKIYAKLETDRRAHAVDRARQLSIIP